VRTLVETQVLVGERGAYRLAQTLPTLQVPATVQAVLAARIDRLPPEEKRLLQTAAVIGMEVPCVLLQTIGDMPEEASRLGLTHLQAAEFLYETQLFPELAYTFTHALTHEVAYGGLLLERRRVLHARIVAAPEARAAERRAEQVERLAHHALWGEVWESIGKTNGLFHHPRRLCPPAACQPPPRTRTPRREAGRPARPGTARTAAGGRGGGKAMSAATDRQLKPSP